MGRTDHSSTRALPEGPGSVGGPMKCPWYLFIGFFECGQGHRGPMIPYCRGAHELSVRPYGHLYERPQRDGKYSMLV
ncbi:unnamed protein product, partial [Staurois parvus]